MYAVVVIVLVVIIITSIIFNAPVDPTRLTFGQRMDEKTVELKKQQLGLDQPYHVQLRRYIVDLSPLFIGPKLNWKPDYNGIRISIADSYAVGLKLPHFRESYQTGRSVSEILRQAFPLTIILATASLVLALVLGLICGVVAALKQNSWVDKFIVAISTLGYSVPSYVTAIVLGVIFGYYLRSTFGLNIQGSLFEINDLGDDIIVWKNLLLPAIALGIRPIAIITQLTRSAVINVLDEKYILVARSKGVSQYKLIRDHVLRNAFNPILTALSGWFAALLAGAFFVEFIFNFKGIGFVTVTALLNYDVPVILGSLVCTSSLFILINIVVDMLYSFLDPRVKY
jgi:peptide/nickel transport system permease protein